MDYLILLIIISFLWSCKNLVTLLLSHSRPSIDNLPPGPPRWPVIGNFLDLGMKPHQSLTKLSKSYGPIMSLKVGYLTTIVVTSPELAQQILQVHDRDICSRFIPESHRPFDHDKFSISFLPADSHWRSLRKLCNMFVFSSKRIEFSQSLRREKVQGLIDHVHEYCNDGLEVDIGRIGFITSLNLMSSTLCSTDVAGYESKRCDEFRELIVGLMQETGLPNVADYVPMLKRLDPQGVRRRSTLIIGKILDFFGAIIEERLQFKETSAASSSIDNCDVLDALLNLPHEEIGFKFTENDINHFFLDLFAAGAHTTSSSVEWAMTELLRNPIVMAKAKSEIKERIGKGKVLQESDLPNLPYLQAVVKETLRLHPATPLIFHQSTATVQVSSFTLPKNSQVVVNAWAISRDPNAWLDPESFKPERFLEASIDFRGQHFQYLPFGGGRRICPGLSLATRMMPLMLGSLVHSFDWKLHKGMKPQDIDMDDKFGITMQKAVPLRAIPLKDRPASLLMPR